jgi:serine/threonine protein kinase
MAEKISKPPVNKSTGETELASGLVVGEYSLEEKIGEGGMGEVWRAVHPTIGKQVAVKILSPELAAQKKAVSRFIQEARSVNEIHHPNLVDIFSFGELLDGRPYFVMELLSGKPLNTHLTEKGPLPFSEIVAIFEQLCGALQVAHQKGIVHRDLKPENIYLNVKAGLPLQLKILDFGIAKLSKTEDSQDLTRTGSIFGTPGYMSPEQCTATKTVDHRTDIYALGIILYELTTGSNPFIRPGESVHMAIARQVSGPPPKPSKLVRNRIIPEAFEEFSLRALAFKMEDRPQSCNEFYAQMFEALGAMVRETWADLHNPRPATRPEDYYAGHKPNKTLLPSKPPTRRFAVIGAAFSIALGFAGTAAYLVTQKEPPAEEAKATPPPPVKIVSMPVASAPAHPEKIKLTVESTPDKADVIWKGEVLGQTPLDVEIPYGESSETLQIVKKGFLPWEKSVTPSSAQQLTLVLNAEPKKEKKPKKNDDDPDGTGNPFGN